MPSAEGILCKNSYPPAILVQPESWSVFDALQADGVKGAETAGKKNEWCAPALDSSLKQPSRPDMFAV